MPPINQPDFNTVAIFLLLIIIVYYVSGFRDKLQSIYKKSSAHQYLNTTARIKSLDYAPDAIITIDVDGEILSWNGGAYNVFGYREREVLGKTLDIIMPERYKERHKQSIEKLKESVNSQVLGKPRFLEAIDKKGREFPVKLVLWKWTEGSHVFYTGIVRDITETRKREEDTKQIILMYERSEEVDKSGTWSWDVLNDVVYTSKGFNRIFSIDLNQVSSTYLLKRVYHEDLKRVEVAIKNAFDNKEGYTVQYRIVNTNGVLLNVEVVAEVYFNDNNELINITGTIHII